MSRLKDLLAQAVTDFSSQVERQVGSGRRDIRSPRGDRDLRYHFNSLRPLVAFGSSPQAFKTAWDLRAEAISDYDADVVANAGGQAIPINREHKMFSYNELGVELGKNKRLILGIRHSEGNYDDDMDDLGRFTYQPPNSTAGMLRYRWCQFLSARLGVPYVLLIVMWFKHYVGPGVEHIIYIAPARIINFGDDLKDLGASLAKPLELQLITRSEAYSALNLLDSLDSADLDVQMRTELMPGLAREWSFDKINSSQKGRQLKRWAQRAGLSCPGQHCRGGQHHLFRDMELRDITFGHIIPQKWAKSFTYLLPSYHHPDNLYLTCNRCNSSLNDAFPDPGLRGELLKNGTVGDMLRNNEKEIRDL
jgi:hypothetical protein